MTNAVQILSKGLDKRLMAAFEDPKIPRRDRGNRGRGRPRGRRGGSFDNSVRRGRVEHHGNRIYTRRKNDNSSSGSVATSCSGESITTDAQFLENFPNRFPAQHGSAISVMGFDLPNHLQTAFTRISDPPMETLTSAFNAAGPSNPNPTPIQNPLPGVESITIEDNAEITFINPDDIIADEGEAEDDIADAAGL